jgi:hypothetical protein
MASTTLPRSRLPPPRGVIVNFMAGPTGNGSQVPRRGTCKCVRAGFVGLGGRSGAGAGRVRVCGRGGSRDRRATVAGSIGGGGSLDSIEVHRGIGAGRRRVTAEATRPRARRRSRDGSEPGVGFAGSAPPAGTGRRPARGPRRALRAGPARSTRAAVAVLTMICRSVSIRLAITTMVAGPGRDRRSTSPRAHR